VSERWRQIERLYHLALEQEEGSRAAFIAKECAGDQALRQEIESLLAAGEGADSYLETPAIAVEAKARAQDEARWSLAGKTVSHYRVVERLDGGVEVYRGEDTRLGRPVTLRFLQSLAGDSQALERFQREARAACLLNHPNVCTVYDIDEWEGVPFLVTEFLEGQTLDYRLTAKALTIDELLDLALQIADGLEAAHSRGVWDRDVRPANLFITTRGQAKILDFGLSPPLPKIPFDRAEPTAPALAYLSPEKLRNQDLDVRTDLFSLGAVLYEMATGRRAFDGGSNEAIVNAVLNRVPASVLQLNPSLPPKLDDVIGKALQKNRERRYRNVVDLRADLKRLKRDADALRMTGKIALIRGNAAGTQPAHPERLGRYQIKGELGEGGMGTVYQAVDPVIGRSVAIKTILQETLGSPKEAAVLRQRLMREARAAGSLTHPNIVTVFDAGEEGGVTYIVMELIRGSTLAAMLPAAGKALPTQRALAILAEAAAGLDFAHSRDVVHRDIKPSNLMIQEDGTVKLTDFGIAKLVKSTTFTKGSLRGTPFFVSPEQLRGEEATPRSDQYSLAVVAWILLTGTRPFEGGGLGSVLSKILDEEPPKRSDLNPAADGVLRRALAKNPLVRFESCSAFAAALRDACLARPAANGVTGWAKRPGILVAVSMSACLMVGAGVAWRLHRADSETGRQEQQINVGLPGQKAASPTNTRPMVTPSGQVRATGETSARKVLKTGDLPIAGAVQTNANDSRRPGGPGRPLCQAPIFDMKQYGDAFSGEMVWTGFLLSGGRLKIAGQRPDIGRVRGDVLPQSAPVRVSVSPATVRLAMAPAAANCWQSPLVLQNSGEPATKINVRWEVYQP
jgi:serine/threonine protein kinase